MFGTSQIGFPRLFDRHVTGSHRSEHSAEKVSPTGLQFPCRQLPKWGPSQISHKYPRNQLSHAICDHEMVLCDFCVSACFFVLGSDRSIQSFGWTPRCKRLQRPGFHFLTSASSYYNWLPPPPLCRKSRLGIARRGFPKWVRLKINQEGLRNVWSMFPLTRVPFWYRLFEPQPSISSGNICPERDGWEWVYLFGDHQKTTINQTWEPRNVFQSLVQVKNFLC